MKKFIIFPILLLVFSFVISMPVLADCKCVCKNSSATRNVTNEKACDDFCAGVNANRPIGDPVITRASCSSIAGSGGSSSGPVRLTDPLGITKGPEQLYGRIVVGLLGFVGIASLVAFVYAGFVFLISSGNPERVKKAKDTMLYAVIGVFVAMASYAILSFIFKTLEGATQ